MRPPFEQFYAYRRLFPIAELTPDGRRVLYVSDLSGQFNLWSVSVEGGRPEQLTTFVDQSVRGIAVRGDGAILFMADSNGDEFHQLYRIPPEGGWPEQLTSLPQVQHAISAAAWSPDGSAFAFAANSRKPTDSEIFIWHEGEPEARWLFGEDMLAYAGPWSPDGTRLVAIEVRTPTALRLHVVDVASGHAHELPSHEEEANIMPGPWAADGSGFYLYSNEGREFAALGFYSLERDAIDWLEIPDCDVEAVSASKNGRVLAWLENDHGWARLRLRDVESGGDLRAAQLPAGTPGTLGSSLSVADDGSRVVLVWDQPSRPPEVFLVETATGAVTVVTESRAAPLGMLELREPELIEYESFDGREIPAWLYRPDGDAPAPFALIIHGGPHAQERPNYRPYIQYLVSRGIGVLATNIRGSTGYGKTFERLVDHDWGGGDLEDWRHAAEWLKSQSFVDETRLAVAGGSYGGFATLTCVTRLPDYWRAAVDLVGPSNLVTFSKAVPPQWRRFMASWVGDPETEEDFLLERSPITYVDDVRAPLLVIQGANDPRVVKGESDQMVERLRALEREVEYVVFEDEGHGFTRHANDVRAWRLTCEWLERHLTA